MEKRFLTEHLFLLIGGNPLPNAVAGKLLAGPGGTITLVHSRETAEVAQRLQGWLHQQGDRQVELVSVQESDPASIFRGIHTELQRHKARSVGLHYTGGTKAMAVHAYRAVEAWARTNKVQPVCSYLNARTLEMVFDPQDPASGERGYTVAVGQAISLQLEDDLLRLHGWIPQNPPTRQPVWPRSARALAETGSKREALKAWQAWVDGELRLKCRRTDKEDWKNATELRQVRLDLPTDETLTAVVKALRHDMSLPTNSIDLHTFGAGKDMQRLCAWLDGKWLEYHTLQVLNDLAPVLALQDCAQNIETRDVQFDVDVVALRGYQLFALSCSTDGTKGLLKSKLFEAYIRARQLGGDEARIGLICCSESPGDLEREMRRDLDASFNIKVFGRLHLFTLATHLTEWIQTRSQ